MSKSLDFPVKILLADDSITMHRAVSLALKNEAYQLICVDNGKDALRLVTEQRPHVVLLDLDMPEKTGIEVAQAIRQDSSLAGTQLILLCGSFDDVNEKDVEKAPVDARLWKPFESHVLLAMLRTLMSSRNKPLDSSSFEATLPYAATSKTYSQEKTSPPIPITPPKIEPIKSYKESAIENAESKIEKNVEIVQNQNKAQTLKRTIEETKPLEVKDLFDPAKKTQPILANIVLPIVEEDFSKSLTKETFREDISSQDSVTKETPLENLNYKFESHFENLEVPFVEETLAQNLWDTDEATQNNESTVFSSDNFYKDESEPTSSKENTLDFEILSSDLHSLSPIDFPNSEQIVENVQKSESLSIDSSVSLKELVEQEVKRVFQDWLQTELKKQLNEVLSEIDKLDHEFR